MISCTSIGESDRKRATNFVYGTSIWKHAGSTRKLPFIQVQVIRSTADKNSARYKFPWKYMGACGSIPDRGELLACGR